MIPHENTVWYHVKQNIMQFTIACIAYLFKLCVVLRVFLFRHVLLLKWIEMRTRQEHTKWHFSLLLCLLSALATSTTYLWITVLVFPFRSFFSFFILRLQRWLIILYLNVISAYSMRKWREGYTGKRVLKVWWCSGKWRRKQIKHTPSHTTPCAWFFALCCFFTPQILTTPKQRMKINK